MRAIVSDLQRAVFQVADERLVAVANIVRVDSKKCRKPTFLCLAVTTDQPIAVRLYFVRNEKEGCYKKKRQFALRDVKTVDGINPRKLTAEFDLVVDDRLFRFCAFTTEEKDSFIKQLYKFANKYLPVQKPDFVNIPIPVETPHIAVIAEHVDGDTDEGQYLLKKKLIFAAYLHVPILRSVKRINLPQCLHHSFSFWMALTYSLLWIVKPPSMNLLDLLKMPLKKLISWIKSLTTLISYFIISRCCAAARALQAYSAAKVNPSIHLMVSYKERTEQLNHLTDRFIEKLIAHMSALFSNLNDLMEVSDWHEIAVQKQSERFHALRPFSDLMGWLKSVRPSVYQTLIQRYVQNTKLIYKKEFERFFEGVNGELSKIADFERRTTLRGSETMKSIAEKSLHAESKVDSKEVIRLVEVVLGEIGPVVESEQKFCTRFFHMAADLLVALETQSTSSGDSGIMGKNVEKQVTDQVRAILSPLFESLHDHFDKFIKSCCQLQQPFVFVLFVFLSNKAPLLQDASSYFSVMVFGRLVVLVKRQMDAYLDSKSYQLAEIKFSKRVRIGILESVYQFVKLARIAEAAFVGTERRADLDRWYIQLITSLKDGIECAAISPFSKSPAAVVRFENYHHLYSILSELKIDCLDWQRKEAKKAYQDNIQIYVKELMERSLEKMHHFFESIENLIRQGVKPEEVAFHQQFSRLELKKVISLYPEKEIKKGLEQLYKKIEKHLTDDSPLLQVVWRNMQDEFLKQLKHYNEVMGQCYPNSRIDLEISIQDVLSYFSQFAMQH
uniref:BMA-SEC-3 n=1 Tax=Brugia malayi TaxID=6279 RepID=A0A7I4KG83_BRUMA